MPSEASPNLESLLQALSVFKQELAKVIFGMQQGGDRKKRRDLARRMDACKRHARALSRQVDEVLAALEPDSDSRPELETAAIFVAKVQELGEQPR